MDTTWGGGGGLQAEGRGQGRPVPGEEGMGKGAWRSGVRME